MKSELAEISATPRTSPFEPAPDSREVRPLVVLYAEDSVDDAYFMQRAFAKANFPKSLVVVADGLEATRYLGGNGAYANRSEHPMPGLILLDIKMPNVGGLAVLEWIRRHEEWNDTPVLMLTSSTQQRDAEFAYKNGADGYLVKPATADAFRDLVVDLIGLCAKPGRPSVAVDVRGVLRKPASSP